MRLSDCFIELIAYINYFRIEKDHDNLSVEKVRKDILKLIEKSEKLSEENEFLYEDYNLARFAVFVWIDETIMQSLWTGKSQWKKNLLQRQFYKTSDGGVTFYKRLEKLEPEQNEIREVYYLCLVSGFSGMYGNSKEDIIIRDDIKAKNLKRLTGTSDGIASSANDILFTDSYINKNKNNPDSHKKKSGIALVSSLMVFGPLLIFIFLFILYRFILNKEMITTLLVP